jgi:hypothetical protein
MDSFQRSRCILNFHQSRTQGSIGAGEIYITDMKSSASIICKYEKSSSQILSDKVSLKFDNDNIVLVLQLKFYMAKQ